MTLKEQRAIYVQKVVAEYNNKPAAIRRLSQELFLTQRAIYKIIEQGSKNRRV